MLNRDEIYKLVSERRAIVGGKVKRDLDEYSSSHVFNAESSFQPGSIDLHVGEIFVPNSNQQSQQYISLKPGSTILVKTKEELSLPKTIGGLCLAPASLSLCGILIVNIGHIDPGFRGRLHFTLVNLGKEDKEIRDNDRLTTVLLFKYKEIYNHEFWVSNNDIKKILPKLASSFMNYEKKIDTKIRVAAFIKPVIITVVGFSFTVILSVFISSIMQNNNYRNQIDLNYKTLAEQKSIIEICEDKLTKLEDEINGMKISMQKIVH